VSQGVFSKASILDLYGQPAAVANPPVNTARLYYNSTANTFNVIDSNGNSLLTGGSPGGPFLPLAGGTMTGTIAVSSSLVTFSGIDTLQWALPEAAASTFDLLVGGGAVQPGTGKKDWGMQFGYNVNNNTAKKASESAIYWGFETNWEQVQGNATSAQSEYYLVAITPDASGGGPAGGPITYRVINGSQNKLTGYGRLEFLSDEFHFGGATASPVPYIDIGASSVSVGVSYLIINGPSFSKTVYQTAGANKWELTNGSSSLYLYDYTRSGQAFAVNRNGSFDFQNGITTKWFSDESTTLKAAITGSTGKISTYNAISTVSGGVPAEYATVDLTAQTDAIVATTLYAATITGMYRVSWSATITTAATTGAATSTLGGTNGFQVVYTSPTDSVVKTTVIGNSITSSANTTGTAIGGCEVVYAKTGTNIQYKFDYASNTANQMAYELHVKCEAM
jgi:hypothetical protein